MRPTVTLLGTYLGQMSEIKGSGEATDETSYYPVLAQLLNGIGVELKPAVHCVMTPKNRGSGTPDGALFLKRNFDLSAGGGSVEIRAPERGVIEAKGLSMSMRRLRRSKQVAKYLERYRQVLITNYREFQQLSLDAAGEVVSGETYCIASSEKEFWTLAVKGDLTPLDEERLSAFLERALLADAPLSSPEDLARFLAAYARLARDRIEEAGDLRKLESLKMAFQDALGLRFDPQTGEDFFRSALVQTLFYGVFASWVDWSIRKTPSSSQRFSWRTAHWTLNVPMVRVLFDQLVTPRNLPAGIDQILDWTEDVFARVDPDPFFARFERRDAVRYFYEPFLQAYDPQLRRELGVWYTPPEVVRYMVARVHEALQRDLGISLGLADERVRVLDPCTGTGSFLVEALRTVVSVLEEHHGDSLVGQDAKDAVLRRFHGFEILPAPFIIAHLQIGLFLSELGAPLKTDRDERPSVYLTNALTGWKDDDETLLMIDEFRHEREAAGNVKRAEPILVVLGNPPYNGFVGIREDSDDELLAPYKDGLSSPPWEVTKNKLDDYYVRFFRVAERRIAEQTGRGIVCFISNFGWLGDPSAVLMRQHLTRAFDQAYVDNLNGDSRETGKRTPEGEPDPSIFSTKANPTGIQVGTAITLLVRKDDHNDGTIDGLYRDFWGPTKAADLELSLTRPQSEPDYEPLMPDEKNWYRLRRWQPRPGYETWPSVVELARRAPELGLNENRGDALIDTDRDLLEARMRHFLDGAKVLDELDPQLVDGLLKRWARYDAKKVRDKLISESPFSEDRIVRFAVRPFDVRYAYVDTAAKLWNEARGEYVRAWEVGRDALLVRRRAPRANDGSAFTLSSHLVDQHHLHKDAYAVPLLLANDLAGDGWSQLFPHEDGSTAARSWRPNLSRFAVAYLAELGIYDVTKSRDSARVIWLHALAIGYSPLYLKENGDALGSNWPRIPLPDSAQELRHSAALGARVGALLDIDSPLPGLDTRPAPRLRHIGETTCVGGGQPSPDGLALTAGWGRVQVRKQPNGVISRAVMPGKGRVTSRARTAEEAASLTDTEISHLGTEVLDVYLNDETYWKGVPEAAWNYKVGGFQVLRKWLSYREAEILGRPLTFGEAREFRSIVRRVTEFVLAGPELDSNYRASAGMVDQDPLPQLAADPQG